jgi:hypothetical protein
LSSRETVGSVVMPPSIFPCCIAAMNVFPAPTGSEVKSPTLTPFFTAMNWVRKFVDEPRPVTPRVLPFQSAGDLISPAFFVETSSTSPGAWLSCTIDSANLPFDCKSIVWS